MYPNYSELQLILKQTVYPKSIEELYMMYLKKYCAFFSKHIPIQVPAYIARLLVLVYKIKTEWKKLKIIDFSLCGTIWLRHSILSTDIF